VGGLEIASCGPLYSKASRSTGTGVDVMKRIAAPMIGAMVSSTILTLLVIPVVHFV
jgi:Cu/Ag efflux pump CusA